MENEQEKRVPAGDEAERLAEEIAAAAAEVAPETPSEEPAAEPTQPEETESKKKPPLWLWIVIGAVVLIGLGIGAFCLFSGKEPEPEVSTESTVPTTTTTEVSIERVENPINFKELRAKYDNNEDIIAWVDVPNTNVHYEIAQSAEDESEDFYLHNNLNKEYEFAGTVYMQKINSKDFTDPHTVLYGHSMLNGTMFKTLHKFQDKEFFDANPEFTIYTPEHILTYRIFAAYRYDDRHLLYAFDTKNKTGFGDYLKMAQNPASMSEAALINTRKVDGITADCRIVTLSTCISSQYPQYRYLVQGVLVDDQLTYPTD